MKLIIDIDDKDMDKIKQSDKAIFCDIYRMMANIIQHGIPLDDIKAEIDERLWEDDAERVFEIIDKHMGQKGANE